MKYSCYYILCFGCLMGFTIHFYITFGTNLLTGGPAQNCCFFAFFSISKKRNIKRSSNGMKPLGAIFLEQTQSRRLEVEAKKETRRPRGRRARPHPRGQPGTLLVQLRYSMGFFWSKNKLSEVSGQLDSV